MKLFERQDKQPSTITPNEASFFKVTVFYAHMSDKTAAACFNMTAVFELL